MQHVWNNLYFVPDILLYYLVYGVRKVIVLVCVAQVFGIASP